MKLTKQDFFDKFNDAIGMDFSYGNVTISGNNMNWILNRKIQKMVGESDNCYFIRLEYKELVIRID